MTGAMPCSNLPTNELATLHLFPNLLFHCVESESNKHKLTLFENSSEMCACFYFLSPISHCITFVPLGALQLSSWKCALISILEYLARHKPNSLLCSVLICCSTPMSLFMSKYQNSSSKPSTSLLSRIGHVKCTISVY